jgi:NitT/TauT family transport system permease protein
MESMRFSWLSTIRGRVPFWASVLLGALPVLVLLLCWWYYTQDETRTKSPLILPSPADVLDSIGELLWQPEGNPENRLALADHLGLSFKRIAQSFGLALLLVLPLGILMGAFGVVRALFSPLSGAAGYIPFVTLLPLTMSWLGTGEALKVGFLTLAFAIFLLPMIVKAIDNVPDVYLRTAYTLGATRFQVVAKVLVPIALPDIWHALRLAFGVGWTYLVFSEGYVQEGGLGNLIAVAQRRGIPGRVYLVILIITLIAFVSDLMWSRIGKMLFPYKGSQNP